MAMQRSLAEDDADALSIIERTCSIFSLLGCVFIIVTFTSSKAFRKPINRLVFYASIGNAITNVATMMARSYIHAPDSFGCQFQAFLIQMFMGADVLWILSMAINVYLTFYYKFDAERLRKMEILYFLCCYGIPLVPALTYIFVRDGNGHRVYGNAGIWCWVTAEWEIWRILTFYGPIWFVLFITFFIYIRTGGDIYRKRQQLRDFDNHGTDGLAPFNELFVPVKTTEVHITTEAAIRRPADAAASLQPGPHRPHRPHRGEPEAAPGPDNSDAIYSVSITANPNPKDSPPEETAVPVAPTITHSSTGPAGSGTSTGTGTGTGTVAAPAVAARRRHYEANSAAWHYAKCAFLFFAAILITWIPSSANRVYSMVHGSSSGTPLEYMSAFVLPLQGFWNAIIYVATSWSACKVFFADLWAWRRPAGQQRAGLRRGTEAYKLTSRDRANAAKSYESESTTELANTSGSRSVSHEQ
ncbi:G-protein coupled receptor [Sodiomyces alkalinus F11]|uniref:G-protein coupled receptor n=1 Tax=Sodiomyces alkalinus (strain CBS 110278 / VKM F-3762 / F11) TaxID=1314773 RepID=A0A3N2Q3C2_SODAK|nr:G-protein coupled receptor [Sodiomyces alkalinus F11]ROT41259.1 G-protein coupled receptor [Sodiomyces alkalinus F11]